MPFNKFGNFLNQSTKPHILSAHQFLDEPPLYKSICIVSVNATSRSDSIYYFFETTSNKYKFHFSGIVQHIDVSTENILFSLNESDPFPKNELIGKTLKKDDVLSIIRKTDQPPENNIFVQFVLLCPLIK